MRNLASVVFLLGCGFLVLQAQSQQAPAAAAPAPDAAPAAAGDLLDSLSDEAVLARAAEEAKQVAGDSPSVDRKPQGPKKEEPSSSEKLIDSYKKSLYIYRELYLSVGILVAGIVILVVECIIILWTKRSWQADSIVRMVGITLVVFFSAFLVCAGYSNEQINPVIGLLGSVAGYLLGRSDSQARTQGAGDANH